MDLNNLLYLMVRCVMVSGRVGRVGAAGTGHVTSLVDSALGKYLLTLTPTLTYTYTYLHSVAEPDPHVFGPPGSVSFYHSCKYSKKTLDSYYYVTLFDFLSLKNYVNVPSKSY
jgi:hypothetical protein